MTNEQRRANRTIMENETLKRYYRGETTIEEERQLRTAFAQGELPDEPILAFRAIEAEAVPELEENIRRVLKAKQKRRIRTVFLIPGGIAATLILIISLRSLLPNTPPAGLQLSDNLKKERFENALRIIGNVLEEKNSPAQKVLYEDNKLVITIE